MSDKNLVRAKPNHIHHYKHISPFTPHWVNPSLTMAVNILLWTWKSPCVLMRFLTPIKRRDVSGMRRPFKGVHPDGAARLSTRGLGRGWCLVGSALFGFIMSNNKEGKRPCRCRCRQQHAVSEHCCKLQEKFENGWMHTTRWERMENGGEGRGGGYG